MIRILVVGALTGALFAVPPSDESGPAPVTVEVRMVDKSPTEFVFEPAEVTVRPGDVVRFVQTGVMPHNVEFRAVPEGVELAGDVQMGRYLTRKGETYDLVIDERFGAGKYDYVCTPHSALGMTGTISVTTDSR